MRLMSYNIHSGKNMDNILDIPAIAKVVNQLAPDICALNEVRMRTKDVGGMELAREIADASGMYWRFGRAIDYNGGEYGNAILSRCPISFSRVVPVPDVPEEERERRFEPRSVLETIVLTDAGPVQALTCHFGLTRGEQERAVQTVLSMVRTDMPCVFMGDLNIEPDNDLIAVLRGRLADTAGDGPMTFPARDASIKIDYIFASQHFSCGEFTAVPSLASDHLPVYVDADIGAAENKGEHMEKREKALQILHGSGLWQQLGRIGQPHLVGSVRMDLMAVNDIDVDILNTEMDIDRLYSLTSFVLREFRPNWYEAREEINAEGKTVWFHGFTAQIDGELWNFDLWFFDRETIEKAEAFCDAIEERANADPEVRRAIIGIKEELNRRGLYRWDLYNSMDVYSAVLEQGIRTAEEFLKANEHR